VHQRTKATLLQLEELEWFGCVGARDTKAAHVLTSRNEAIASCASQEWEDHCLEAANHYRQPLLQNFPKRTVRGALSACPTPRKSKV
jgi:hypothetical protein